jgi:hypothetical protein
MSKICRKRTFFSLILMLLLCISSIRVALACTLCMDSKVLSYFPGLDLLYIFFLIYIITRLLSALVGSRKIVWKWVGIICVCFFIIGINFGMLIAVTVTTTYLMISLSSHVSRFKRPLKRGEKLDLGLLVILIIVLCGVYRIGKIREKDDEWLLRHLGTRASAEINYQRLTQLPHINGLCDPLKNKASLSYIHETSTGWLSRLALEKGRCKEELTYLYIHNREKSLSSVYIPLILMTDQGDDLWVEICKDQSSFDHSLYKKDWITRLDEARKKVKHECSFL